MFLDQRFLVSHLIDICCVVINSYFHPSEGKPVQTRSFIWKTWERDARLLFLFMKMVLSLHINKHWICGENINLTLFLCFELWEYRRCYFILYCSRTSPNAGLGLICFCCATLVLVHYLNQQNLPASNVDYILCIRISPCKVCQWLIFSSNILP